MGLAPIQLAHALSLAADVCAASSASFGYFVVTRISAAQDAKWEVFGSGEPAGQSPAPERFRADAATARIQPI